ncbi:MAG: FAD/NAD(P)-binding protein [Solirubrobacterales bacterium]
MSEGIADPSQRGAPGPGPMVPEPYRVLRRRRETPDTWTLELEPRGGGEAPAFEPGQFNMLYGFGVGEVPISISGDPAAAGPLVHTVRAVGPVTEAICAAQPGDVLGVRGPFGRGWPVREARGGDLVVVAGGLGLAPLRPAVLSGLAGREGLGRVVLLYGGREPGQLLFREELERWASELEVALTVDTAAGDWRGEVGVVTRLIERASLDPGRSLALVCGPEAMMSFTVRSLRAAGLSPERIHLSLERNMKCAVTLCGRCQFGAAFACREGPVFSLAAIEPIYGVREL